jgi:hypothetical protein
MFLIITVLIKIDRNPVEVQKRPTLELIVYLSVFAGTLPSCFPSQISTVMFGPLIYLLKKKIKNQPINNPLFLEYNFKKVIFKKII